MASAVNMPWILGGEGRVCAGVIASVLYEGSAAALHHQVLGLVTLTDWWIRISILVTINIHLKITFIKISGIVYIINISFIGSLTLM